MNGEEVAGGAAARSAALQGPPPPAPAPAPAPADDPHAISPLTLDPAWSHLQKLAGLSILTTLAAVFNVFFVCAFFVEKSLTKSGNVYLACTGMADLVVSLGVGPVLAVLQLAHDWVTLSTCRYVYFMTALSTYTYSLYFFLAGLENFFRLACPSSHLNILNRMREDLTAVGVLCIGSIFAALDAFVGLNYDYCERLFYGDVLYRFTVAAIFHVGPFFIGFFGICIGIMCLNRKAADQRIQIRRSQQYHRDLNLSYANAAAYLMYGAAWAPHMIVSLFILDVPDQTYYYTAWVGVLRTVVTSGFYMVINKSFKDAFMNLFCYCFCKSSLHSRFTNRHRRTQQDQSGGGGGGGGGGKPVAVHVMAKALSGARASPRRAPAAERDTHSL